MKVLSSVEESSSIETKHIRSLGSTHEPSPEPWTPKERVIHPLEFPIEFKDYGNTLKHFWHNPHEEAPPKVEPLKEWLMEVKRSSKAIRILSPSTTIPCSLMGTTIKAIHNSMVKTKHIPSLGLTHEPSAEPRTPKEWVIHPLEFPIKFEDYGNTSKHFWHNPHEEVSPKIEPSKEWLMELKRSSKAI